MRRLSRSLYILFFASCFITGSAQISLNLGHCAPIKASEDKSSIQINVTNTSDSEVQFFWDILKDADVPNEWEIKICDTNTCYDWEQSQPCEEPAHLAAGKSYAFTVYIKPQKMAGIHNTAFRILGACDGRSNVLAHESIHWNVQGAQYVVGNAESENIMIYPNPTDDSFRINDDLSVKSIAIFNIIGKNVLTEKHIPSLGHDISTLQKGIYLVRLMDSKNETVKVIRLTKK